MNYSVNPNELLSIYAIPSSVADEHIKLASEYQLKTLLLFLRNQQSASVYEDISKKLGLKSAEVAECLDYWVQRGVLVNNESDVIGKETVSKQTQVSAPTGKPTREEAVKRIDSSEELKYLFTVAQEKFSRMLTTAEMCTLVWLHDNQGLSVPIIIQAIQYATDSEKLRFSYLEKVCVDWAKNDITTIAKAEERLNQLYLAKSAWGIVEKAFGIAHRNPTENEKKYANKWVNEFEFNKNMLIQAYNICADNTSKVNFKYIDTILTSWHKKGYKTPDDIVDEQPSSKSAKGDETSSFSLEKAKKKINNFD